LSYIDQEREGEQIDRALLKSILSIFVEIGMGNMDCYENDFESANVGRHCCILLLKYYFMDSGIFLSRLYAKGLLNLVFVVQIYM